MAMNIFAGDRTAEKVAYDIALALAAKDPQLTTPEMMMDKIAEILPSCRELAKERRAAELPKPFPISFS